MEFSTATQDRHAWQVVETSPQLLGLLPVPVALLFTGVAIPPLSSPWCPSTLLDQQKGPQQTQSHGHTLLEN